MLDRFSSVAACSALALCGVATLADAQTMQSRFMAKPANATEVTRAPHPAAQAKCRGAVNVVQDVGDESVRFTAWNFGTLGGGGDGGRFDPVPLLSTTVSLQNSACINAHLSAILGSAQTYGGLSALAVFQVSLTPLGGLVPQHMFGHFETPYGLYGPAIGIEAETDVDTFGANFFQSVGFAPGDVPPGIYTVDVWWAGGPATPGGALTATAVLKLYY